MSKEFGELSKNWARGGGIQTFCYGSRYSKEKVVVFSVWSEGIKQGCLRHVLKVSHKVEENLQDPAWGGWKIQTMIYES
jgi:hypothetical protein